MIHVEINKVYFQGGRSLICGVASLTCGFFLTVFVTPM
jgi:hypothetical protein